MFTVYRETLTKGKFDEFYESGSNRQIKTNAIAISTSIFYFNLLLYRITLLEAL